MFRLYFKRFAVFSSFILALTGHATNYTGANQATIEAYESSIEEYILKTTPEYCAGFNSWIDATLALLPPNPRILEIGSAFGRDAQYIESKGFSVERTDATQGFVCYLNAHGYPAHLFNVITEEFTATYDLIFANRVFLHFNPDELEIVLHKIKSTLHVSGILAFSLKQGEGEELSEEKLGKPRYYCYWSSKKIKDLLKTIGFEVVSIEDDGKFLQVIAKK